MLVMTATSAMWYFAAHARAAVAVGSFCCPARTSSMTAFGIRIAGARRSIKSRRAIRENRMSGEALTTHASLTMDLVLQFLGRHLRDGDAPMCELVNEFRAACAGDLRSFRLRELSLRVPEQSCRNPHLLHELRRRQAQRRECAVREIERYRGHWASL